MDPPDILQPCLTDVARDRGFEGINLHSQVKTAGFYSRLGFEASGESFVEAGIDHVMMARTL